MAVSYNGLWKILIDKKMGKLELRDAVGMGSTTLAKLGKCEYVSMDVLERICIVLGCQIGDIVEFISD